MLLPHGGCPDSVVSHEGMDMDMGEQQVHQCDSSAPHEDCSCCNICHLACTGYLGVPGLKMADAQTLARENTFYLVVFNSVTSAPPLHPPVAHA